MERRKATAATDMEESERRMNKKIYTTNNLEHEIEVNLNENIKKNNKRRRRRDGDGGKQRGKRREKKKLEFLVIGNGGK